jgi:hypothetical protein
MQKNSILDSRVGLVPNRGTVTWPESQLETRLPYGQMFPRSFGQSSVDLQIPSTKAYTPLDRTPPWLQ